MIYEYPPSTSKGLRKYDRKQSGASVWRLNNFIIGCLHEVFPLSRMVTAERVVAVAGSLLLVLEQKFYVPTSSDVPSCIADYKSLCRTFYIT